MLVRASTKNLHHDAYKHLQPSFDQLHLPWLCPALHSDIRRHRHRPTSTTARAWRPSYSTGPLSRLSKSVAREARSTRRGLASAAVVEVEPLQDDYIPFEGSQPQFQPPDALHSPWSRGRTAYALRPFENPAPIIIKDSLATAPRRFRTFDAVSGELDDIHQTLDACLQVGRLERAAAMMRRLNKIYKVDAPELTAAHNHYIQELVQRIIRTKDQQILKDIQRWFEVDLRSAGVLPDATTYALMIQASLQESEVNKVDRTVRRYVQLAEDAGMRDEAMITTLSILNEQEVGRITRIAPTYFHKVEEISDSEPKQEIVAPHPREASVNQVIPELTPELNPVDQKGLGLGALKKSLSLFSDVSATPNLNGFEGTEEEKLRAYCFQRQLRLEEDAISSAVDRWRTESAHLKTIGINNTLGSDTIGSLMWQWHELLIPRIQEEVRKANQAEEKEKRGEADKERCIYGPFLQFLPAEKLSAITILHAMTQISAVGGSETGAPLSFMVESTGNAIHSEVIAESIKNKSKQGVWEGLSTTNQQQRLGNLIKTKTTNSYRNSLLSKSIRQSASSFSQEHKDWSISVRMKIGAVLISNLIDVAEMEVVRRNPESGEILREPQPVFSHAHRYHEGKRRGVIRLNPAMIEMLSVEPVSSTLSKHLPMVVEPVPWTDLRKGGFLQSPVNAIRIRAGETQLKRYARTAAANGDMDQVFAGLDVLGKTPWKINRAVFQVMLEVWNTGEAIAKIPPQDPRVEYPPEPPSSADASLRQRWAREMKSLESERAALHSQRCFLNFQLEVARAYLNETFYFPHNVDFRGRAYPIPPFLNHMGADNCRGLLVFGKGKELGSVGLTWLKVHLANVYGFDKASFEERSQYSMDHLEDIYDSANNPLKGKRWWLTAEDPWQTLAACVELRNALDSPDPLKFVSSLAIHQDGTCNGLQHYAALGGDVAGAKQVNLEPGDRPSDIYSGVANMVKAEIADDAAQGIKLGRLLDGKVTRKVVKATVMTNVYGVTFRGATMQVRKQLEEIMPNEFEDSTTASVYVVKKIFKSLSTMFNGAHDIQYWLAACAARISEAITPEQMDWIEKDEAGIDRPTSFQARPLGSKKHKDEQKAFKSTVIWTSPLKMPIVQPYRKSGLHAVTTNLQKISISRSSPADPVHKRKQLQAFPPNFIHSLDATHMILTALQCNEVGLSFAAVHDSFWTHATDVDTMNKVIRESFVRLHSEDIIGRLAAEFATRYHGHVYLASVANDSIAGRKIQEYRRSLTQNEKNNAREFKTKELLRERRRLRLLASDIPEERLEGESMITASKIFAEIASEQDLAPLEEMKNQGIGQIPSIPSSRTVKLQANEQIQVGDIHNVTTLEPLFDRQKPLNEADSPTAKSMVDEGDAEPAEAELDSHSPLDVADSSITRDTSDKEDAETAKEPRDKPPGRKEKVWLWLPLTFPPVPKKGDFDISKLKDSQYFFS